MQGSPRSLPKSLGRSAGDECCGEWQATDLVSFQHGPDTEFLAGFRTKISTQSHATQPHLPTKTSRQSGSHVYELSVIDPDEPEPEPEPDDDEEARPTHIRRCEQVQKKLRRRQRQKGYRPRPRAPSLNSIWDWLLSDSIVRDHLFRAA